MMAADQEMPLELEHAIGYAALRGGLHYHPNGREYVYSAGASVVISDLNESHNQSFLRGHDDDITALSLSRSGRYIASGQRGENADALVWDYAKRKLLYRLSEHDLKIAALGFSHDDALLCTAGGMDDAKLIIWDMSNGYIVTTIGLDPKPTISLAWGGMRRDVKRRDTDDYQLCTAGGNRLVLWTLNPYTGEIIAERINTDGRVVRDFNWITFSADYESIFCATTSGDFTIANVKKKIMSSQPQAASRSGLEALAVLTKPNGNTLLVVGGGDGRLSAFSTSSSAHHKAGSSIHTMQNKNNTLIQIGQLELPGAVVALTSSPDGSELLAGVANGAIYRLRSDLGKALLLAENHARPVKAVSYADDASDKFATSSLDRTLRVWDANDYKCANTVTVRDAGDPTCLVFTLDFLVSGWTDGKIRAHDMDLDENNYQEKKFNSKPLWLIDDAHRGGVTALVLAKNRRFIVSGGTEGEIRVWEIATRQLVSHLKEHRTRVTGIALYQDAHHALSCSRDRSLLCWDLRAEKRLTSHTQRMGGMNAVALSKDQTNVFTVGQEKRLTRWDIRDHNFLEQTDLDPPRSSHDSLGTQMSYISLDTLPSNEQLGDEATCLAVSHSGTIIATGGTQKELKLWHCAPGHKLIGRFPGHSGTISDLKFSPDDKQLVSVGEDGVCFVWNIFC